MRWLVTWLAVVVGFTPAARAQDADVEDLLRQGVALRESGRDADALPLFEQAYARSPSPRTAAQLGLVNQALAQWVPAEARLREALASPEDPWIGARRQPLEQAYAFVLQNVARIEVTSNAEGASLYIDGERIAVLPPTEPIILLPGTVVLEVRADGYEPMTRSINLAGGATARQSFQLERQQDAPIPPIENGEERVDDEEGWSAGRLRFTWVALGAAATFGGIALGTWIAANREYDDLRPICAADPQCDTSDGARLQRVSFAMDGLWAASLATAVLLFYFEGRAPERSVSVSLAPGRLSIVGAF